jgi:hypothetical protein
MAFIFAFRDALVDPAPFSSGHARRFAAARGKRVGASSPTRFPCRAEFFLDWANSLPLGLTTSACPRSPHRFELPIGTDLPSRQACLPIRNVFLPRKTATDL